MARPECMLAVLGLLAAGTALPVSRPPDPLEGVKASIRVKDFAAAAKALQRLADAGNAEAQYLLAVFFLNGLRGPPDPVTARSWLEKSAAQGNARAAFSLASFCTDADPPDPQCAAHWLARARELGFRAPAPSAGSTAPRQELPSSLLPSAQLKDPAVRREALWLAAADADLPGIEALADPTLTAARDEFGRGALARAAQDGSGPAVTLLIHRGAPVDAADDHGVTPLMLAARSGEPAAVEALLAAHASVAAADRAGNTALMYAAISGRIDAVDRLLAAGASVTARDAQDWSALDFAQQRGAADVAARLTAKGATALARHAVESESPPTSVQRAQRDLYAGWPDLAVAAARPSPELLHSVLGKGADANAATRDGLLMLSVAVLSGTPDSVEALLAAGAQTAHGDSRGISPLLLAAREGRADVVAALLAHGASADGTAQDPEPRSWPPRRGEEGQWFGS